MTRYELNQLAREAEAPRQKRNRERREERAIALFKKQLESMMDLMRRAEEGKSSL